MAIQAATDYVKQVVNVNAVLGRGGEGL